MNQYNYLALGDSYTIGEQVALHDAFPYQLMKMLRKDGLIFQAPEIVAKTGWTTGELLSHLKSTILLSSYSVVTLLIGVNNQYRALSQSEYASDFRTLLNFAVERAHSKAGVFVLSIPDWGLSPFASDRDTHKIKSEIDDFNGINASITEELGVTYIDITTGLRELSNRQSSFATDDLHPSGTEYNRWAKLVYNHVKQII